MYIQSIKIEQYKILKDLELTFQAPKNGENVLNVVAGVNGCGKTSLLHSLFRPHDFSLKDNLKCCVFSSTNEKINNLSQYFSAKPKEKIILIPAQLDFNYKTIHQLQQNNGLSIKVGGNLLGNAEFYIREYVIAQERQSHKADPQARAADAVAQFNQHFQGADLLTKLHDVRHHEGFNRPMFKNINGDLLSIEQLSDGEKQLYARAVALMIHNPEDSIILIDEPELALHPRWQQEILNIYQRIGKNNQFIIATHSPYIIANTPAEHLILLAKENNKIVAISRKQAPIGRDINSILQEIMGADIRPSYLENWYRQYRQFIETEEENSPEAKALREKILQQESLNSEFMQEMQLLINLRSFS